MTTYRKSTRRGRGRRRRATRSPRPARRSCRRTSAHADGHQAQGDRHVGRLTLGCGPTFVGTIVGQAWVNEWLFVAFLARRGPTLYVVIELLAVARRMGYKELATWGILLGLSGFATTWCSSPREPDEPTAHTKLTRGSRTLSSCACWSHNSTSRSTSSSVQWSAQWRSCRANTTGRSRQRPRIHAA